MKDYLVAPETARKSGFKLSARFDMTIRYEEDEDRYVADDTYLIRRRVTAGQAEWQIKHISSLTWTNADTILRMAEAIREAQQRYTEQQAEENGDKQE